MKLGLLPVEKSHAKENLFKSTFIQRTLPEEGPTNVVISNKDSNFIGY